MKRKISIALAIIILLIVSSIYLKSQIHLKKAWDRPITHCNIKDLDQCDDFYNVDLETILELAQKKTAKDLSYSMKNDIDNSKANCVGYAQYAATICNYAFKQNKINAKAKPVVGFYYLGGINLHNLLTKYLSDNKIVNFVKNHDYVEILDSTDKVIHSFDPCLYDYTWLDFSE